MIYIRVHKLIIESELENNESTGETKEKHRVVGKKTALVYACLICIFYLILN